MTAPPTYFNDVWTFNGTNWSQVTVSGASPPARTLHGMAYNADDNKLYLFGGRDSTGSEPADLWTFDPAASSWTEIAATGPAARQAHGLAYDNAQQILVLVGGVSDSGDTVYNDTWHYYDGSGWIAANPPVAVPNVAYHTLIYDSTDNQLVLLTNSETWIYK